MCLRRVVDDEVLGYLREGSFFGEVPLLDPSDVGAKRTRTLRVRELALGIVSPGVVHRLRNGHTMTLRLVGRRSRTVNAHLCSGECSPASWIGVIGACALVWCSAWLALNPSRAPRSEQVEAVKEAYPELRIKLRRFARMGAKCVIQLP